MSILKELKEDLKTAMKSRDRIRIDTLRSLISSIENAGAVPVPSGPYELKVGLDHDVERAAVSEKNMRDLVAAERDESLRAAAEYRELGRVRDAEDLELRARIAGEYLT